MEHTSITKPTKMETLSSFDDSEDYCFVCKDGGTLILCDNEGCTKAYHENCIERKSSADYPEDQFICGWHACCKCGNSSTILCLCCPNAVCQRCISKNEEFSQIRGENGICDECLKLALMVEEGKEVDSEGEEADFNDRESSEGLFKEYWDIVKVKQNITLEDLKAANAQMESSKKLKNAHKRAHSDEYAEDAECVTAVTQKNKSGGKRGRPAKHQKKEAKGLKVREFIGWGSKPLIDFLHSIGKDTSQKLTQGEATEILIDYARENKLFDPVNKKRILADAALQSILGRKTVTIYRIRDSLEGHLIENLAESDESSLGSSSEDEEFKGLLSSKKLQKHSLPKTCEETSSQGASCEKLHEEDPNPVADSCYASIVPANIQLVYLNKRLLVELLKEPEIYDHKVIGGFVLLKSTAYNLRYELHQVTDIIRPPNGNNVALKVSCKPGDILISMISEGDFKEEECEALRQKVEQGILERPTVVDLQEKVNALHEPITKQKIARELFDLKHRIDLANEKGRRDEYFKLKETRKLLQTPEEQERRLKNVPQVIADVIEVRNN